MLERSSEKLADVFPAWFPTPTKGNGFTKANNLRPGKRQPDANPSPLRKVSCKQCGFLNSLHRVASSGGDLSGDGGFAGNALSGTSAAGDLVGEGNIQGGAGCALCGSKNFASGATRA